MVPPNVAARSAPRLIRICVWSPKSLKPWFFSIAPIVVASSLYWFFDRPRFFDAAADAALIAAACFPKTVLTPPTDCCRSDAPLMASEKNDPMLTVAAAAARGAKIFLPRPTMAPDMPPPIFLPALRPVRSASASTPRISAAISLRSP